MLTFHRRRSGLRRDVMTAQMPASGLKQAGSMKVITNLSKCGLMTDSGLTLMSVRNKNARASKPGLLRNEWKRVNRSRKI